ncbi:MAG: (Fe-S)-binding protein, partial [Eubacteriales bacterium]|nr:(Fe-S)-binding protein [Eubacteriales bacterium]
RGKCLKCRCDLCIRGCSHMQHFQISPDAYIRQINHNERIILGTHYANKMINSCTLCGLCKEQCFLDISMREIIRETRDSMVKRGKMPLSAHDFALKDMQFSSSSRFAMVRGLRKGTGSEGYLFYPGCQLSATHSAQVESIYRHLAKILTSVGICLGCCGAPADWAGRQDLMEENIAKIRQVWAENEHPVFILACPSCIAVFDQYLPEISTISLWEILDRYGLPEKHRRAEGLVLSIHDACAARYRADVQDSIRRIAASLGCSIQEPVYTREKTKCCGYGGLVYYANREQAEDFVRDRIRECPEDLLVYCAMCRDLFADGGKRTYHILDLICMEDLEEAALRKKQTLSERQDNRMKLKHRLLQDLWGEEQEQEPGQNYDFKLTIPEAVTAVMEERHILAADIEQVIDNARKKRERFFNLENSNCLARLRLDHVTYWVRYEEKGNDVFVSSVYSHRMEAVEE